MSDRQAVSKEEIEALAHFRYQLRRFERFSEVLTRKHGVTQLQYLLLLQIKGFPQRDWVTIAELAERLQAHHHGVVSLLTRCEKLGLVMRSTGRDDRRTVEVRLTPHGDELVTLLAGLHRNELLSVQDVFAVPNRETLTLGVQEVEAAPIRGEGGGSGEA